MGKAAWVTAMFVLMVSVDAALAQAPTAEPTTAPPAMWFVYTLIIVIFIIAFVALGLIRRSIEDSHFSLGDALSEEGQLTVMEKDAAGHDMPRIGSDGRPVTMTVMVGSISRVIALLGTIALMILIPCVMLFLFTPRPNMHPVLEAISDVLPMSYAVDGMNEVLKHTDMTADFVRDAVIVAGCALLVLTLGAATLRRRTV